MAPDPVGDRRDRVAVALCNLILRTVASRRYRATLKALIFEGMARRAARATLGVCDPIKED